MPLEQDSRCVCFKYPISKREGFGFAVNKPKLCGIEKDECCSAGNFHRIGDWLGWRLRKRGVLIGKQFDVGWQGVFTCRDFCLCEVSRERRSSRNVVQFQFILHIVFSVGESLFVVRSFLGIFHLRRVCPFSWSICVNIFQNVRFVGMQVCDGDCLG